MYDPSLFQHPGFSSVGQLSKTTEIRQEVLVPKVESKRGQLNSLKLQKKTINIYNLKYEPPRIEATYHHKHIR